MKFNTAAAFESSCLQGYIKTTYQELCQVFGVENCDGDGGYKVQAEWDLKFADGTYATIYDWKESQAKEHVTDWHIGGQSNLAVARVQEAVAEFRAGIVHTPALEVNAQHGLEYYGA
jgi:hypothetical protein